MHIKTVLKNVHKHNKICYNNIIITLSIGVIVSKK